MEVHHRMVLAIPFVMLGEQTRSSLMERLVSTFGESEASFLVGFGALWSGDPRAALTHVLAGNVVWMKQKKSLHPLDETLLGRWARLRPHEAMAEILTRLMAPEHRPLARLLGRQLLLARGAAIDRRAEDPLLCACLQRYGSATPLVGDSRLQVVYQQARAQQRGG